MRTAVSRRAGLMDGHARLERARLSWAPNAIPDRRPTANLGKELRKVCDALWVVNWIDRLP